MFSQDFYLEAMRRTVKSEVDFVLTVEEMTGIFAAKNIDVELLVEDPDMDIKMTNAEGLKECRKFLTMAKAGKYNGYLLEEMACPGGCVSGAGTVMAVLAFRHRKIEELCYPMI